MLQSQIIFVFLHHLSSTYYDDKAMMKTERSHRNKAVYYDRAISLCIVLLLLLFPIIVWAGDDRYPAVCTTTANLNIRESNSTYAHIIETLPSGTRVQVEKITTNGWAEINYHGGRAYCYNKYLRYCEPVQSLSAQIKSDSQSPVSRSIWTWLLFISIICVVLAILRKILITILGIVSLLFYKIYNLISFPFYCLNWLQRRLAKPWLQNYKYNYQTDKKNAELREKVEFWGKPLYVLLTPLRLLNAIYYNIVVHCSFELFNYVVEVIAPEGQREGANNFICWLIFIPWRIVKYVIWHGSLTFIESCLWTIIDTFVPTLTVYHGTTGIAAEGICQGPGRVTSKNWLSAVWNVGGGNYAGNGIYFAPIKDTALHYASGSLIVCRVSFGRTLDLGIAPKRIYDLCGKPNALGVTEWGLKNSYVTGEWWRGDPRAMWWEYCMYDWQNRYNDSWRIRPLYVLNLSEKCIQRIPGGMYHWLFNSMVIKDLGNHIEKKLG